ncbi:ABC transporter substrate-binding protein [Gryllotalpicola ginsengisoli]|uniref:ABC transporter substrate-binding protein n=1 Tax=Gryllotalpicola ginsengisoli TaxID=444608 RepID=UPI0003B5E404|nr:sugar ABC transporter substrate-binding protein [Gryllotalpicola ginsengisoli]
MKTNIARALAAGALAALLGGTLVACSGGDTDAAGGGKSDAAALDAALKKGGTIEYWTWTPQAKDQIAEFEKEYPKVKVNLTDTGGAGDSNTKLQNAISAGKGIPDVVQVEYQSVGQFQLPGYLTDLTQYGFADLKSKYTASTWANVTQNGGIWGLPQDSGPMALFYNKDVFEKYDLTVPTTWDQYIADAKKLHEADPTKWLVNDTGDAGLATSLMWQAGGKPFKINGQKVTINTDDAGVKKYSDMWSQLIDQGLVGNISGWSDEWYKALGDGTIATVTLGAWMPGILTSGAPDGAGKWAVAPMPTYDGGEAVTAENGGSTEVVPKGASNPVLGAAFLRWLNSNEKSIKVFMDDGGFPATVADLHSDDFLNYKSDYFGGQQINKVLAAAADSVISGWQYLPWQAYANTIYTDDVGPAFQDKSDLYAGIQKWLNDNVKYGKEQGFTVNG